MNLGPPVLRRPVYEPGERGDPREGAAEPSDEPGKHEQPRRINEREHHARHGHQGQPDKRGDPHTRPRSEEPTWRATDQYSSPVGPAQDAYHGLGEAELVPEVGDERVERGVEDRINQHYRTTEGKESTHGTYSNLRSGC